MKILIAYITLNEMEAKFEIWNRLEIHENAQLLKKVESIFRKQ